MANVYQVYGNHDGVLSIYGSKKRAIQAAIEYVQENGHEYFNIDDDNPYITYIEGEDSTAQVEQFYLK
jgi:predicted MPP superfamily phosphohydrolase